MVGIDVNWYLIHETDNRTNTKAKIKIKSMPNWSMLHCPKFPYFMIMSHYVFFSKNMACQWCTHIVELTRDWTSANGRISIFHGVLAWILINKVLPLHELLSDRTLTKTPWDI